MRVGILVASRHLNDSPFSNGILQNAVALLRLLRLCPNVAEAHLVNTTPDEAVSAPMLGDALHGMLGSGSIPGRLDVLITGTVSPSESELAEWKAHGIRCISHVKGSTYHFLSEQALFPRADRPGAFARRLGFDGVWVSPHLAAANRDLLEITHDVPARVAPLVWTPEFLERHAADLAARRGVSPRYVQRPGPQRVSVFEPNINLVKTCITPVIALEKAFRKNPAALDSANIFAGIDLAASKPFTSWIGGLELHRAGRIFFEGRFPIAKSLLEHTDIVLCHQRDLELNYLYLDAAWLGFPVVHNSDALTSLGLHYPGHDAGSAAERILDLATWTPERHAARITADRKVAEAFLWNAPANVHAYADLLEQACGHPS